MSYVKRKWKTLIKLLLVLPMKKPQRNLAPTIASNIRLSISITIPKRRGHQIPFPQTICAVKKLVGVQLTEIENQIIVTIMFKYIHYLSLNPHLSSKEKKFYFTWSQALSISCLHKIPNTLILNLLCKHLFIVRTESKIYYL